MQEVSASFAEGEVNGSGYEKAETDMGYVYYEPDKVQFGAEPSMTFMNFLWLKAIRMRGITAA